MQKSVWGGRGFSILTYALYATVMAFNYIRNIHLTIYVIFVICVNSKSVVYALKNWDCTMIRDKILFYKVKHLVYIVSCLRVLELSFVGRLLIVVFIGMKHHIS